MFTQAEVLSPGQQLGVCHIHVGCNTAIAHRGCQLLEYGSQTSVMNEDLNLVNPRFSCVEHLYTIILFSACTLWAGLCVLWTTFIAHTNHSCR